MLPGLKDFPAKYLSWGQSGTLRDPPGRVSNFLQPWQYVGAHYYPLVLIFEQSAKKTVPLFLCHCAIFPDSTGSHHCTVLISHCKMYFQQRVLLQTIQYIVYSIQYILRIALLLCGYNRTEQNNSPHTCRAYLCSQSAIFQMVSIAVCWQLCIINTLCNSLA